jgi:hypothetical protein
MLARRPRPTIRRVRDWDASSSLRAPRVPLDLVSIRETPPTMPIARPYYEEDEDDDEKATLARFIPIRSEVRALLDDPEETLAYMRKVQASIPDPDSALDSLVAVYEERVAWLERERAQAAELVTQMNIAAERVRETARPKREVKPLDRVIVKLQPHVWKIVFSMISVWGLLQLALTR